MVSGTFQDLQTHRARLMTALQKEKLFTIGMEGYVPVPGDDVISSSLNMVREASAYVGLISHRYGQVVECPERNPHSYSVSRFEFEEAQRLGLPTLVFIMGHALAAYKAAWADGEPYVFRYALNKARALLEQLGAEIPDLPPYDPAKDEKLPWEDEVAAAIERLRAEKEAEKKKEAKKAKKAKSTKRRPSSS
jgi:hypothetical protein